MAAHAQSAVAASCDPGKWKKIPHDPNQTLMDFEQWVRMFRRYLNVTNLKDLDMSQRWDLMICTGGPQMEDLVIREALIVTEEIPEIVGVAYRAATQDTPERQAVQARDRVPVTDWDEGIRMCMDAIKGTTNEPELPVRPQVHGNDGP